MDSTVVFTTLGMFILDRFEYLDEHGNPTGREAEEQIGGGGTYAAIGARIFLSDNQISMLVDKGNDFPEQVQNTLGSYGSNMWVLRDQPDVGTTRALNLYRGEHRSFQYLTPRIRITPKDIEPARQGRYLHFICSPKRAQEIAAELDTISYWNPVVIYEPIPDRCVPSELPALKQVLHKIHILSPNAHEACGLLSLPYESEPDKDLIERAANQLYQFGIGPNASGSVIIRSGELGAFVKDSVTPGLWVNAYWNENSDRVVDVTGAGNAFLGGLAAGLYLCNGNMQKATAYASVAASFTIEQWGLPKRDEEGLWNGSQPQERLKSYQSL
ncbi:Ribokinase-like protein [Serendipita vermifera]|nr:Ribokinase-like protein [Serendipita vermifera]